MIAKLSIFDSVRIIPFFVPSESFSKWAFCLILLPVLFVFTSALPSLLLPLLTSSCFYQMAEEKIEEKKPHPMPNHPGSARSLCLHMHALPSLLLSPLTSSCFDQMAEKKNEKKKADPLPNPPGSARPLRLHKHLALFTYSTPHLFLFLSNSWGKNWRKIQCALNHIVGVSLCMKT